MAFSPRLDTFRSAAPNPVLWDRWAVVLSEDRMDAYQQVRGAEAVLKINSVLGLTHAEARKLGVEQQLLAA